MLSAWEGRIVSQVRKKTRASVSYVIGIGSRSWGVGAGGACSRETRGERNSLHGYSAEWRIWE